MLQERGLTTGSHNQAICFTSPPQATPPGLKPRMHLAASPGIIDLPNKIPFAGFLDTCLRTYNFLFYFQRPQPLTFTAALAVARASRLEPSPQFEPPQKCRTHCYHRPLCDLPCRLNPPHLHLHNCPDRYKRLKAVAVSAG